MSGVATEVGVRPLPRPTEITEPHWNGARQRRLMVQLCATCNSYVFIPRRLCPYCLGNTLHWVQSSGLGTIYSFTIVHRAPDPAFEIPYCIAIIRLDEDWYMTSNIVGAKMESIAVGCRVRVDFLDVGDVTLPVFTLQVD